MSRPFIFRINAAELFTEIQLLNIEQKAAFITQLSIDFITLKASSEYSKCIIDETLQFIEKQTENGKKGGRPKTQSKPKANPRLTQSKPKAKPEEEAVKEVELKEEEPLKHLPEYSDDFISFWQAYPNKTAKGAAWSEWKKFNPPLPKVLNALEWQTKTKKWQEGFILDPARYIKRRCWEDEPEKQPEKCKIAEWQ